MDKTHSRQLLLFPFSERTLSLLTAPASSRTYSDPVISRLVDVLELMSTNVLSCVLVTASNTHKITLSIYSASTRCFIRRQLTSLHAVCCSPFRLCTLQLASYPVPRKFSSLTASDENLSWAWDWVRGYSTVY